MLHHLNILVFPLILSNIIHMMVIKKDALPFLKKPISEPLFGANKTWRGFLLLPLLNGLATMLFAQDMTVITAFLTGAVLGLSYMIFELPNSWVKRRMGIAPGQISGEKKLLFALMDKSDSAFGVSLVYFLISDVSAALAVLLFLVSITTHIVFSMLLVSLKLKKSF